MENGRMKHLLRPYCIKELADLYEVKPRTIKQWLAPFAKALGKKIGRFYNIKQVEVIFQKLGRPSFDE